MIEEAEIALAMQRQEAKEQQAALQRKEKHKQTRKKERARRRKKQKAAKHRWGTSSEEDRPIEGLGVDAIVLIDTIESFFSDLENFSFSTAAKLACCERIMESILMLDQWMQKNKNLASPQIIKSLTNNLKDYRERITDLANKAESMAFEYKRPLCYLQPLAYSQSQSQAEVQVNNPSTKPISKLDCSC